MKNEVFSLRMESHTFPNGLSHGVPFYSSLVGREVLVRLCGGFSSIKGVLSDVVHLGNHPEMGGAVGLVVLKVDDGGYVIIRGSYIISIGVLSEVETWIKS